MADKYTPSWEQTPVTNSSTSYTPSWESSPNVQQGQVSQDVKQSYTPSWESPNTQQDNVQEDTKTDNSGLWGSIGAGALALGSLIATKGKSAEELAPVLENMYKPIQNAVTGAIEHVDLKPLKFDFSTVGQNIKKFASNIMHEHQGDINSNSLRGNFVAQQVKKLVPDLEQRKGLTLHIDTGGDINKINSIAHIPEHQQAVVHALNPTPEMNQAKQILSDFYNQHAEAGKQYGYINEAKDNYINRIYKPKVKTEVYRAGLPKSTYHGKSRSIENITDAILSKNYQPATLDAADLATVYGEEASKVLANNKLYQALEQGGHGFKAPDARVPRGYVKIGNSNFVVNEQLAPHIKAITAQKTIGVDGFGKVIKNINSIAKANLLSADALFHIKNVYTNFLSGGLDLADVLALGTKQENKLLFSRSGGMLHTSDTAQEVLSELRNTKNPAMKALAFFGDNPISRKVNDITFNKIIPNGMVAGFSRDIAEWSLKNPQASETTTRQALRSFARKWNALGGFSNTTAQGVTANQHEAAQMLMLAFKWNYSKVDYFRQIVSKDIASNSMRLTAFRGLVGTMIAGNLMNNLTTGHNIWENGKGNEFKILTHPNSRVGMPILPAPIEDAVKLIEKNTDKGIIAGTGSFAISKKSPVIGMGLALNDISQNKNYFGKPIYNESDNFIDKSGKSLLYGATQNNFLPISMQSTNKLYSKGETNPIDYAAVLSTLGQVGKNEQEQAVSEYWKLMNSIKAKKKGK